MDKRPLLALTLVAVSALAVAGYLREPRTIKVDNAYVSGRVFRIHAPRSGYIEQVSLRKGEAFAPGAATLSYDQEQIDLQIVHQVETYRMNINREVDNCFALDKALREHERAQVESEHRRKRYARTNSVPGDRLVLSPEETELRRNEFLVAKKAVEVSAIEVERLRALNRLPILERAAVRRSEHDLRAKLNEKARHRIRLPFAGYVYESLVYPGQYVSEGELLAIVVPREELMIEANVLESKLGPIRPGQRVDIELDSHRGLLLEGYVHTVVPSTAATFTSLPRNNTDSNWIKVSQRVPVLIAFRNEPPSEVELTLGASARVSIHLDRESAEGGREAWSEPPPAEPEPEPTADAFLDSIVSDILSSIGEADKPTCKFKSATT